jgi:filamentous hemagglutinin family protein
MKMLGSLLFALCLLPVVHAEVITDGSLGAKVELPGKDFQITPELGQQVGGNLFHSFQNFNLSEGETATFSGANSVQNIIARVTGGQASTIDGTLRSTIPNADLYFLNPYGILFGQHAQLDLQGGFHATTADYLKLQDGGRFDARQLKNSLLTVAPVASFGFLTDSPAPITTQDSILSVAPLKSLSLIGGNLQLRGSLPVQFDDTNAYATFASSLLHTTGGQISLVAVGSSGEVSWNPDLTLTGRGGDITLNRTLIDTSSLSSGNLKIRGGRLQMTDSVLQANTLGDFNGGVMDIQLMESLYTKSEQYFFIAFMSRALMGRGDGGQIRIKTPVFTLDRVVMGVETVTAGNAGSLDFDVTQLNLLEGAGLTAAQNFLATGKGGAITINAAKSILISGFSVGTHLVIGIPFTDMPSFIDNSSYSSQEGNGGGGETNITTPRLDLVGGVITNASLDKGSAGDIVVHAEDVNITEGGFITTTVMGTGLAGNIQLNVNDTLLISGQRNGIFVTPVTEMKLENNQSNISSFSLSGSGGQIALTANTIHITNGAFINTSSLGASEKTSQIDLQADNLLLTAGGQINSSNGFYIGTTFLLGDGRGHSGDIHIQANHLTLDGENQKPSLQQITSISSDTYNPSQGGNLFIEAESLDISHGAAISARSFDKGDAGQINLQAQHLHLTQSVISTAATQAGGGNIVLNSVSGLLHLDNSEITTSVAAGQGTGGNITIEQPQFVVLNQAQIKAQADAGHGGNIRIVAEHFVPSTESLVSASSHLGIDGQISIQSPTEDVGNQVLNLSANYLNAASLFPRSCAARIADQRPSQFVRPFTFIVKSETVASAPEDTRGSPYPVTMYYKWFDQYR